MYGKLETNEATTRRPEAIRRLRIFRRHKNKVIFIGHLLIIDL